MKTWFNPSGIEIMGMPWALFAITVICLIAVAFVIWDAMVDNSHLTLITHAPARVHLNNVVAVIRDREGHFVFGFEAVGRFGKVPKKLNRRQLKSITEQVLALSDYTRAPHEVVLLGYGSGGIHQPGYLYKRPLAELEQERKNTGVVSSVWYMELINVLTRFQTDEYRKMRA